MALLEWGGAKSVEFRFWNDLFWGLSFLPIFRRGEEINIWLGISQDLSQYFYRVLVQDRNTFKCIKRTKNPNLVRFQMVISESI